MFASFLAFKLLIVCGPEDDSSRHGFTLSANDASLPETVVLKFLKFVSLRSHGLHTKCGKTSLCGSFLSCKDLATEKYLQLIYKVDSSLNLQICRLCIFFSGSFWMATTWHDPRNTRKSRLCFNWCIFPFPGTQSMGKLILEQPFHQSIIWHMTSPNLGLFLSHSRETLAMRLSTSKS